jgi:hypothetical protein
MPKCDQTDSRVEIQPLFLRILNHSLNSFMCDGCTDLVTVTAFFMASILILKELMARTPRHPHDAVFYAKGFSANTVLIAALVLLPGFQKGAPWWRQGVAPF